VDDLISDDDSRRNSGGLDARAQKFRGQLKVRGPRPDLSGRPGNDQKRDRDSHCGFSME
jgi:hypothetical protein